MCMLAAEKERAQTLRHTLQALSLARQSSRFFNPKQTANLEERQDSFDSAALPVRFVRQRRATCLKACDLHAKPDELNTHRSDTS